MICCSEQETKDFMKSCHPNLLRLPNAFLCFVPALPRAPIPIHVPVRVEVSFCVRALASLPWFWTSSSSLAFLSVRHRPVSTTNHNRNNNASVRSRTTTNVGMKAATLNTPMNSSDILPFLGDIAHDLQLPALRTAVVSRNRRISISE